MDKFKFRAPTTSANGFTTKNQKVASKDDDELWMDDIDEQTLLQASQIVETQEPKKGYNAKRLEIDPSTLSKMIPVEEDDVSNVDNFKAVTKLHPTQTIFGVESERRATVSKDRGTFQSSFNEPSSSRQPQTKPTINRPPSNRVIVSLDDGSGSSNQSPDSNPKDAIEKLTNENRKLAQLQFSKTGEISFLRSELTKRQSNFEKEKTEITKILELKRAELKELDRLKSKELEGVKSERDFIQRELEQAQEVIQKLSKRPSSSGDSTHQRPTSPGPTTSKRSKSGVSPPLMKRPKLCQNLDESFFEEKQDKSKFLKPPLKSASVQTVKKRDREFKLQPSSDQGDLLTEISTLAGNLSLVSIAESDLIVPLGPGLTNDHFILVANCLTTFCKSVEMSPLLMKKKTEKKSSKNSNSISDSSIDEKQVSKLKADLFAARVSAAQLINLKVANKSELPRIDYELIKPVIDIITSQNLCENEVVLTSASSLLCTIFESGLLSDAAATQFLAEIKLRVFNPAFKYNIDTTRKCAIIVSNLLEILKYLCLHNASALCSKSKGSCFLFFLWCLIEELTCGDSSSNDKEDVPQRKSFKIKNLSEIGGGGGDDVDHFQKTETLSLNLILAKRFIALISSILPQRNLSWVDSKKSADENKGTEKKCRWCLNDVIRCLAAVTWSVFSECIDYFSLGLSPPLDAFEIVRSCILSLHIFWSWDASAFSKAIEESSGMQRRYVWTTKQFLRLMSELKLDSLKDSILCDLTMDCVMVSKTSTRLE